MSKSSSTPHAATLHKPRAKKPKKPHSLHKPRAKKG